MFFTYTAATSDQFIPRHVTPTCPRVTALVESSSSYAVHNNNTMVRPFLHTFSLDPTNDSPIHRYPSQSALFNFQSLLLVILLLICTCTYIRAVAPRLIDSNKQGYVRIRLSCFPVLTVTRTSFLGIFFMSARIGESRHLSHTQALLLTDRPKPVFAPCAGERLSPYVALACIAMAVRM